MSIETRLMYLATEKTYIKIYPQRLKLKIGFIFTWKSVTICRYIYTHIHAVCTV